MIQDGHLLTGEALSLFHVSSSINMISEKAMDTSGTLRDVE